MSYYNVARMIFVAATAAAMTGIPAAQSGAAARGREVFVEVTPSTVQAGDSVNIQAGCDGNDRGASVRSDAFGRVELRPSNGQLTGTARVDQRKPAGTFDVILTCRNNATATTQITVVNMSRATQGPATGGGGTAGGSVSPFVLTGGLGVVAVGAGVALILRARRGTGSNG